MSFLKKLTRSSRSSSYVDDDDYERDDHPQDRGYDPNHPPSSFKVVNSSPPYDQAQSPSSATFDTKGSDRMYQSASTSRPQDLSYNNSARSSGAPGSNGMTGSRDGFVDVPSMSTQVPSSMNQQTSSPPTTTKLEHGPAPDLLARAFNEAVRPYAEKIEELEQRIADMQAFVDQSEQQRLDIYNWIDKRGLRPDVPPDIAKQMDSTPDAASTLNAQLDRKITIVNFDLHRLQDDLNDSISSAHFASAMAKFLPDIQRLTDLSQGPRYAYELLIKLVGNLNSHGGLEAHRDISVSDEAEIDADRRARLDFYERMDEEMVGVVTRRSQDGEDWPVAREIKRLEKNAAYLKNLGIEPYFPRALEYMRQQAGATTYAGGPASPQRYSDSGARQSMQK